MLFLIVTGNPFAIRGDPFATANLESILHAKGGRLINETLNPPSYLRQKSKKSDRPPLILNYGFPQSRELMIVQDNEKPISQQTYKMKLANLEEKQEFQMNQQEEMEEEQEYGEEEIIEEEVPRAIEYRNE
mmetsp:Transcript_42701/g.31228  ORF Transcript_42701/g.31228 Transcript_42701/m.31228 type:complete len:131 (+) Transcript_42701:323-715(+)